MYIIQDYASNLYCVSVCSGCIGGAPWTINSGNGVMLPDIGTRAIRFGLSY